MKGIERGRGNNFVGYQKGNMLACWMTIGGATAGVVTLTMGVVGAVGAVGVAPKNLVIVVFNFSLMIGLF